MDIDNATAVTRGLQGWCYAVAMREHFAVATAALVVGLESQVPSIYRRQYPMLLEKYGFTEEEVEFFDLHIISDEIHGERGYQIVLEHADTPELQQRCLQLVRHGAEARFSYTKALYDDYVAPERRWPPGRRSLRHSPDGCAESRRPHADHPLLDHRPRGHSSPMATRSTCCASRSATTAASRSSAPAATAAPTGCASRRAPRTACRRDAASASGSASCRSGVPPGVPDLRQRRRHRRVGSRPDRARRGQQRLRQAQAGLAGEGRHGVTRCTSELGPRSGRLRRSSQGRKVVVDVDGREMLVLAHDGAFYAFDNICIHRERELAKGVVLNGKLVCPGHQWAFALDYRLGGGQGGVPAHPSGASGRRHGRGRRDGPRWCRSRGVRCRRRQRRRRRCCTTHARSPQDAL